MRAPTRIWSDYSHPHSSILASFDATTILTERVQGNQHVPLVSRHRATTAFNALRPSSNERRDSSTYSLGTRNLIVCR